MSMKFKRGEQQIEIRQEGPEEAPVFKGYVNGECVAIGKSAEIVIRILVSKHNNVIRLPSRRRVEIQRIGSNEVHFFVGYVDGEIEAAGKTLEDVVRRLPMKPGGGQAKVIPFPTKRPEE